MSKLIGVLQQRWEGKWWSGSGRIVLKWCRLFECYISIWTMDVKSFLWGKWKEDVLEVILLTRPCLFFEYGSSMVHAYVVVRCCVTLPENSIDRMVRKSFVSSRSQWSTHFFWWHSVNANHRDCYLRWFQPWSDGWFKALSCDGHHFRLHQTKHEAIFSLIDTLIQSHTVIIHCHYIIMTIKTTKSNIIYV